MQTESTSKLGGLQPIGRRTLVAAFDARRMTSDGGALLLREVDQLRHFFARVAGCFVDHRAHTRIEHSVEELLGQRSLGIALGYQELNDHDDLRYDPTLAMAVGKVDPLGNTRKLDRDRGRALAGHATLNRLETAPSTLDSDRPDLKILHSPQAFERLFVDLMLDAHDQPPNELIIDLDATDDRVHGTQEGRSFHGYYGHDCFLPLYIFCGEFLLAAKLRRADQDGAAGSLEEVARIVAHIREQCPRTKLIVRADSGFCRDAMLDWCESQPTVEFVIGLARNSRLAEMIKGELEHHRQVVAESGHASQSYKDLDYRTKKSGSRERRVVAKAEVLTGKDTPRFVVTSLSADEVDKRALYEDLYCARGDMENRLKAQQLGMFADRTSSHTMRANPLRLWFSSLAYVLVNDLRTVALRGTPLAKAQVWTIRVRLLKVGALVRQSVRRLVISLRSSFPLKAIWLAALAHIQQVRSELLF